MMKKIICSTGRLIGSCLVILWLWPSLNLVNGYQSQHLTLGIVVSNPNISNEKLSQLLHQVQSLGSSIYANVSTQFAVPAMTRLRLHINPVHASGLGIDKVIRQLFCSAEARGTNAILILDDENTWSGQHGAMMSNFITALARSAGLPAIVWSSSIVQAEEANNDEFPLLLLAPSIKSQAKAIYSLLKKFLNDRKVSVLISPRAKGRLLFLNELQQLASGKGSNAKGYQHDIHQKHMNKRIVEVIQLENVDNFRKDLVYLRDHTESKVFVVYADQAVTDRVMEEAHVLGMSHNDYIWICGKPSFGNGRYIPNNYVTGLLAVSYNTSLPQQFMAIKAAMRGWSEAVRRFVSTLHPEERTIPPPNHCNRFMSPKWTHGPLFHRLLSQRLSKVASTHGDVFTGLHDLTLMALQVNRHWAHVGDWTEKGGLVIENNKWLHRFEKRVNYVKTTFIRVATLDEPPYVAYKQPPPDGVCPETAVACRLSLINPESKMKPPIEVHDEDDEEFDSHFHRGNLTTVCCVGFVVDLLKTLSTDIGFSFEMTEVADRKWGALDASTGKWNGLVKALLDGKADMVATSLKMNTARSSAVDFSIPFYETGITILVRTREGLVSPIAFLEPFSVDTWLVVFFGCVNACAFCIFSFESLAKVFTHESSDVAQSKRKRHNHTSLFGSFWLVLAMLFNAAMKTNIPKSISGRFVANVWAFFCVIFMSSFMANLAAFMITKEEFHDFEGIDDYRLKNPYTKNPPWKFSTIPHGATEQLIKTNNPEMYEYMRRYTRDDVDEGVAAVKSGELDAFIYDASVLSYKAGRDKNCKLRTVGKWYAPTGYGLAVPKHSKLLPLINKHIVDYQVSGYLQHLVDFWLSSSCKELFPKDVHRSAELGIVSFLSSFGILGVALCCCALFFGLEFYYARSCRTGKASVANNRWDVILRLISPGLGKARLLRERFSRVYSTFRPSATFSNTTFYGCQNVTCQCRVKLLQHQLVKTKERVRELEASLPKQFNKEALRALASGTTVIEQYQIIENIMAPALTDVNCSCACSCSDDADPPAKFFEVGSSQSTTN